VTTPATPPVIETDSLVSGLTTRAVFESDEGPTGLGVTWIAWFSSFRGSGLRIGDRITRMNGEAVAPSLVPRARGLQELVGLTGESRGWEQSGARVGDLLVLGVWRPDGEVEVRGTLRREALYRDASGKPSLAPGGPANLAQDGFAETWSGWHEKLVFKITQVLDGSWERAKLDTRRELSELLQQAPRIGALRTKYPGDFAERTREDFEAAAESLGGRKYDEVDLGYRELGARRLEGATRAAAAAWAALLTEGKDPPMPAEPVPAMEERAPLVGKWIEMPVLTQSGIINDLGQTWAVWPASGDGGYVARMTGAPEFERLYRALQRFGALVQPGTSERFQCLAELLPMPAMITFRGRPFLAHQVRLVAARAGDAGECFVDVRAEPAAFAGEAEMQSIGAETLPDDASPAEVLAFMVTAIKRADEPSWRRCFADWEAGAYETGRPHFLPIVVPSDSEWSSAWEAARRLITRNVLDVRVARVGTVQRVFGADPRIGVPAVDRVVAYLDHIGEFDGEYRAFNHFTLTRRRVLQRKDNGPWRLVEVVGL
jgi:hypothetical protein